MAMSPSLFILYGSATGNAEHIAKDLAGKTPPPPFESVICEPLEKFKKFSDQWMKPLESGKHGILVVTSTTGNGDPPENASRFVRYIKRKATVDLQPFQHVAFAVLGLGDTNYDQFCAVGKAVDKKLGELGGFRARDLACADEATGLEDVVEPWVEDVLNDMSKACSPSTETAPTEPTVASTDGPKDEPVDTPSNTVPADAPMEHDAPSKAAAAQQPPPAAQEIPTQSSSPLYILYGSATGNAEHIAKDLASQYEAITKNPDGNSFFPSVVCCELNKFRTKCLPTWEQEPPVPTKHGVIVVTATTGNGDAPENADRFVRFIKRRATADLQPFKHVAFAVLGLGDTNYDQFCATGKIIDKKLQELGGVRAKPVACADEATGLEDVVEPWTSSILLDITNACRGGAMAAGETTTAALETAVPTAIKSSSLEEKKMDAEDGKSSSRPDVSRGVKTICSLLSLKDPALVQAVDHSTLPSLCARLSSCELLSEETEHGQRQRGMSLSEMDGATVSSASSTAQHYTFKRPFEATILGARYLTNTSKDAARRVFELMKTEELDETARMSQARTIYNDSFPIDAESSKCESGECERNGKRVIDLELSLPDDYTIEYQPGDSLGMIVENTPESVDFILSMLRERHGISPDQKVSIDSGHPVTVEAAVRSEIDLCSPLKSKRILHSLSQLATGEEAKVLRLLASKTDEGCKLFQQYIDEQRISVVDILREFPSCQSISLEGLLGILPGIAPRYYSVSSSPLRNNLSLHIALSVVDYLTPSLKINGSEEVGKRRIGGLATRYLEIMSSPFLCGEAPFKAPTVKIFPKPTAEFRMPEQLSKPIILIGPGTGVAPFIGFLLHRKALVSSLDSKDTASAVVEGTWRGAFDLEADELPVGSKDATGLRLGADFRGLEKVGSVDLFFGCRHKDHDWLYSSEMEELHSEGIISHLNTAFSRDGKRQYVQDIIRNDSCSARLSNLILNENASVYICGDGNAMAKDVKAALVDVLGSSLAEGTKEAETYVEYMKNQNRFLLDIWSS